MKSKIRFCGIRLLFFAIDYLAILAIGALFFPLKYLTIHESPLVFLTRASGLPLATVGFFYFFLSDYYGKSLGKHLLGLHVTSARGEKNSLAQAFLRAFLVSIGTEFWSFAYFQPPPVGITLDLYRSVTRTLWYGSILCALIDSRGRTLIDYLFQTEVTSGNFVDVPKRPALPLFVLIAFLVIAFFYKARKSPLGAAFIRASI